MTEAFLKIVNMSISAGWLVLAVLVMRLLLKKAPRWVHVLLWGIVAVRLICPFSIESALSLIPSSETISPEIMMDWTPEISTGIKPLDQAVNPVISTSFAPAPGASANPLQILIPVAANFWLLGVLIMLAYTAVSCLSLCRKLRTAVVLRDNIFQCETVHSPFVLGILRPRIYLPYTMDGSDLHHVVAHEQTHIRRKDHWWKPLGFLLLTVYWFNPLMWVAYILLCRDIELACDEKVIAQLGNEQRADYTQALVACSVNRRMIAACPLAFGEVGVKERVKSIMNYRKPTFWIIVTALAVCALVAVCFLTDPNSSREFSLMGQNVTSLDPEAIVERIVDIEDIDNSGVYVNSNNFSLTVNYNFDWMDSQTVRYFYYQNQETYSAQLRMFPEEGKYFLTEPDEWPEQDRIFLLQHYLEALKYLPQYEIQQMAPADRYLIRQIPEGTPSDYDRVITYTPEGAQEIDGWFIHLRLEPLHAVDQGYHGVGDEVIDVFFSHTGYIPDLADFSGNLNLGLNGEIIEIDSDNQILYVKDADETAAVFGDRCALDCSWASARYNLLYVDYNETDHVKSISFDDFRVGDAIIVGLYDNQMETAFNGTAIATQVQLAEQRMNPTQTNLRGLVAGYLFTPFDGETYRYALTEENPTGPTADELLDTFTEDYQVDGVVWEVYTLKEYPDKSKLLLRSGVGSAWLCEYAPAQRAEEGALEAAKAAGYVIVEDGKLTEGKESWETFYEKTRRGEHASIQIAHYLTLDESRTAPDTYAAYRQDYPALYIHEISYDGESFVLRTETDVRIYEYLMKYHASATPTVGNPVDREEIHYVLTHDRTHTWDQLWRSLLSSAADVAIDHYTVCSDYN